MMESFPPHEDSRAFRDALGSFATGVTVVTCAGETGPLGITANSFASVSLDPPLVLWSPAKASRRFAAFSDARRFAIHVLEAGQRDLAIAFTRTADAFGAADPIDWVAGPDDVPLINGCIARFLCETHAVHDAGDHAIVVGRVVEAARQPGKPLIFQNGRFRVFGETD